MSMESLTPLFPVALRGLHRARFRFPLRPLRVPRTPTYLLAAGRAHALSLRSRRAAGPASSLFPFLSGRVGRRAPASSSRPAARPRPFHAALAVAFAAAFSLLLAAGAAEAQTSVKLVGNTWAPTTNLVNVRNNNDLAQAFTTGSSFAGYKLTRVDVRMLGGSGSTPIYEVTIRSDSSGSPGASLGTLTNPSSWPSTAGPGRHDAPSGGIQLKADTTYWLVIDTTGNTNGHTTQWLRYKTPDNGEDDDASAGWSIADGSLNRNWLLTSWDSDTTSLIFEIHGYANPVPAPVLQSAAVNGATLTMTFDRPLDPRSAPPGSAFTVDSVTTPGLRTGTGTARIKGRTATVTLDLAVRYRERVYVSYTRPASGKRLRNRTSGLETESFAGSKRVANNTPHAAPEFVAAGIQPGSGRYLSLLFSSVLDGDSEPPDSAFTVRATSPNGRSRTIRGARTGTANVSGNSVYLELASAVKPDESVTLSYRKPSTNPLIDRRGLAVESFSDKGVKNGPPRIRSLAIVSNPGGDRTYERGDTIRVEVRFTGPVIVNTRVGAPRLLIKLLEEDDEGLWWIQDRWADYERGGRTETLTFAYEVGSSDRGGLGIGVPYHSAGLNSGKIFSLGPDGQSAEVDLRHGPLGHDRNHKVDGGISRPRLVSAAADGATLTVTFNEALDTGFVPAPGAFRVTVNGARRSVASGGVSISGASVTLTLASPVAGGDTVALRYVKSGAPGCATPPASSSRASPTRR